MKQALAPLGASALLWTLPNAVLAQTQPAVGSTPAEGERARSLLEVINIDAILRDNTPTNWLILLGAIFLGLAVGKLVSHLLHQAAARMIARGWHAQGQVFESAASPASLAIFSFGFTLGMAQIAISPALVEFRGKVVVLLYTLAIFWFAYNLVSIIEMALRKITARTESTLDDQLVPLIRKSLRIFLVIIGLLFVLQNVFERDIGAWLAGLGIAGLAVSLAAQDSLKNLFGSVTIFLDRPFLIGHRIIYQGFDGNVEEIGFRSTKVRLLNGSLVSIPNSLIVNDPVENVALRPSIRRIINVTITYDTPLEKVREAVEIIRNLLTSPELGPEIASEKDPPRAYFDDLNADSLNIKVWYWYQKNDWWAYLDHAQRFNLALMHAYEQAGIEFAFPTQTLYLAGDQKRELAIRMLNDGINGNGQNAPAGERLNR